MLWGHGHRGLCLPWTRVLGAFAQLRKKRLLTFVMSVWPHVSAWIPFDGFP